MAEDPATWGALERAVDKALDAWDEFMKDPDLFGPSRVQFIADKLSEQGVDIHQPSKHSYFCQVCVKQVYQGETHRCVGGNW